MPFVLGGLMLACGGESRSPAPSTIASLTIDPVNPTVAVGTSLQLHVISNFKSQRTEDVSTSATWVSADPTIANVSNTTGSQGLTTGVGVGTTTITARFGGMSTTATFTVTNATLQSVTVTPVNPVIANGTTVQLVAVGNFSDGSTQNLSTQVTWDSGNSGIATVSNTGLVTGASAGPTQITATQLGVSGSTTVVVSTATVTSITITPVGSIAEGTTLQLTATCNLSDGTTQDCTNDMTWASSNSAVATVSDTSPSKGLITGVGVGDTPITGSFKGEQGSATVTVTKATLKSITVTPPAPSIANGTTVQLTAVGTFSDGTTQDLTTQVSWISADENVAHVSNVAGRQGLVTGRSAGSTPINATFGTLPLNGVQGAATVTVTEATLTQIIVTPANQTLTALKTVKMIATAVFSDGTTQDVTAQADWTSSDDNVAHIISSSSPNTNGELMARNKPGTTTITATIPALGSVKGLTSVTVS